MGATFQMFSQDTVMKRISKSTLKLWRKQARENVLGRESRGRKACPAFETAFLAVFCVVQASIRAVNGVFFPPFPLFFVKKNGGR